MGENFSKKFRSFSIVLAFLIFTPIPVWGWSLFQSTEGGYQVLFPQTPTFKEKVRKSFIGDFDENTYSSKITGGENFSVEYTDLPAIAVGFEGDSGIINKVKKGLLKSVKGTEQSFTDISLQGHAGKELQYSYAGTDGKTLYGKVQFYVVKKRLYAVSATSPQTNPPDWDKFFNSFSITSS